MMCSKQKYKLKEAKTVLNECQRNKGKQYRKECRYYLCECGWYHLTSKNEWEEPIKLELNELIYKEKWKDLM